VNLVLDTIGSILLGALEMGLDVAPFLLLGFLVAGALRVLLPEDWISRRLGGRGPRPVLAAALVGIPLPLCSCGVIPAALGLRKQGASRGATLSFLVSTPETGVDSIAVTYAILGPVLAIVRPVAAFVNAVTCGVLTDLLTRRDDPGPPSEPEACACCGGHEGEDHHHTLGEKLRGAVRFAFVDLLGDIAGWLLLGLLLAGAITAFLSPEVVQSHIGSEWAELGLMLLVSVPLYICATASTPVAAALVVAGFSPGAAIVLLLAGPATNIATLLMVGRFLGRGAAAVYLGSIAATSLTVGWIVNRLAGVLPMPTAGDDGVPVEALPRWLLVGSAILLAALMAMHFARRFGRIGKGTPLDRSV
jgi:uncharacterized membrane protein YraQ (UPF0718 family)